MCSSFSQRCLAFWLIVLASTVAVDHGIFADAFMGKSLTSLTTKSKLAGTHGPFSAVLPPNDKDAEATEPVWLSESSLPDLTNVNEVHQDITATVDESDLLAATAVAEAAVEEPVPLSIVTFPGLGIARHAIPISIALVIGTFSVLEILESLRELSERKIVGHAHGITILAFLRLGRSMAFFRMLRHKKRAVQATHRLVRIKSKAIVKVAKGAAILQTQSEELQERAEELSHVVGMGAVDHSNASSETNAGEYDKTPSRKFRLRDALVRILVSPGVAIAACVLAVVACVVEIVDDMKPGAHHGAALLALSELYYQFRRLKARVKKNRNRTSSWRTTTWMGRLWTRAPVGPMIAVAAAVYAGLEIYEDMKPGAHHGVAILALAELVENVNRSRILHQLPANTASGAPTAVVA